MNPMGPGPLGPPDTMNPYEQAYAQDQAPAPAMPLPPVPPPRRVRPEPPKDKKELEDIQKYVAAFAKASRSFVKAKEDYWTLLLRLKENILNSRQWRAWRRGEARPPSQSRKDILDWLPASKEEATRSDYAHSLTYALDWSADTAWAAIFDGPQWLTVIDQSTKPTPATQQDPNISTLTLADMVARLLTDKLERTQIHGRVTDALSSWADLGTGVVKTSLLENRIPVTQMVSERHPFFPDQFIENPVDGWEVLSQDPLAEVIPLHRFLPDPQARHNDVQRWDMVGHWVEPTYDEIVDRFKSGMYGNVCTLAKFKERWDGLKNESVEAEMDTDEDSLNDNDERARLRVYELHGKVPTKDGLKEGLYTLITDKGIDDPSDGLLVRVVWGPVLMSPHCAQRPFSVAHFYQRSGPFGVGMLERCEKLLYLISNFVGYSQDIAMRCAGPATAMSGDMIRFIEREFGGAIPPGARVPLELGEQEPKPLHQFDLSGAQLVDNTIKMLLSILDRWTVSEITQGMGGGVETAHEAQILNQQSMRPTEVRMARFAQGIMKPMLNQALGFITEYCEGDQTVTFKGQDGQEKSYTITEEDLRDSRFVAYPVIAKQDAARLTRARALLDMLNNAANYTQMLQTSGYVTDWGVPLKQVFQWLDADPQNQALRRISTFEQQLIGQIQQLQQQLEMVMNQPAPGGGNGKAPPEKTNPGIRNGGPLGGEQTDLNLQMQESQMNPSVNPPEGWQ